MDARLLSQLDPALFKEGSAEERLASYLLDNLEDVAGMTIRELSRAACVSASTVERLCRRLGCSGYRDFQHNLAYGLAFRRESEGVALAAVGQDDTTAQIIDKVTRRNVRALEIAGNLLRADVVDNCVRLIRRARVVSLFGIGASFVVAKDLQQKLRRVDRLTNLDPDWQAQLLYARNMTADDLAIAVSYSGLTRETAECARTARERGAKVIAITRNDGRTRLAHCADIICPVGDTEAYLRSGAMSSRMACLNVVDVLYMAYLQRDIEGSARIYLHNYIGKDEE